MTKDCGLQNFNEKKYYKDKIQDLVDQCDSIAILEWLYHFLLDGMEHWK